MVVGSPEAIHYRKEEQGGYLSGYVAVGEFD
jgi:hypothetical protein